MKGPVGRFKRWNSVRLLARVDDIGTENRREIDDRGGAV